MLGIVVGSAGDEIEMVVGGMASPPVSFSLAEAEAFHAMFGRVLVSARGRTPAETLAEVLAESAMLGPAAA